MPQNYSQMFNSGNDNISWLKVITLPNSNTGVDPPLDIGAQLVCYAQVYGAEIQKKIAENVIILIASFELTLL